MLSLGWASKFLQPQSHIIYAPSYFTQALPAGIALEGKLFLGRGELQECMYIANQTSRERLATRDVLCL